MDFVGLPVYSWGCAAGHAIRMAARLTGRTEVLVAAPIDPERLAVIRTYCEPPEMAAPHRRRAGRPSTRRPAGSTSPTSQAQALADAPPPSTSRSPSYLGVIEADARGDRRARPRGRRARRSSASTRSRSACSRRPADYGADIVVGPTQPLGVHMNCGGGVGGFIATRDEERYVARVPDACWSASPRRRGRASTASADARSHQTSYGMREEGNDWTGNSVYLWADRQRRLHGAARAAGLRASSASSILQRSHYAARRARRASRA